MLEQVGERIGREHYREERQESRLQKAERLVCEGLNRNEPGGSDLPVLAKGDLRKIEIAQRLREETGMTGFSPRLDSNVTQPTHLPFSSPIHLISALNPGVAFTQWR